MKHTLHSPRYSHKLALVISLALLTGCNSNDHDTPSSTTSLTRFSVTPSLGKIVNARVMVRNALTGLTIAEQPLNNGTANFSVASNLLTNVPVLTEVLPNATGDVQYYDEATQQFETLAITSANRNQPLLRAAAPLISAGMNLGITAMTEAAVQNAIVLSGGAGKAIPASNITAANQAVQQALGLNYSVLQAPAVIGALTDYNTLVQTSVAEASRQYAAQLASLAKLAKTQNSAATLPALEMAQALAADLSDGTLNGAAATGITLPTTLPYDYSKFAQAWQAAMTALVADLQARNLTIISQLNSYLQNLQFKVNNQTFGYTPPPTSNTEPAQALRTVDGVSEYACTDESKLRSGSGPSINMNFVNQRGSSISIYWLNSNGTRMNYRTGLASGQTHSQQTFVTHPWLITDSAGQCLGIYVPVTASEKTLTFNSNNSTTLGTGNSTDTSVPATVNSALDGNYTLIYKPAQSGGFFTDNQSVSFSINSSKGVLSVNGMPLGNPVHLKVNGSVTTADVVWEEGNIQYVVSNNVSGQFGSLRLYDKSKSPSLLGQFIKVIPVETSNSCAGNTNPFGCLSISGDGAMESKFEHVGNPLLFNGGPQVQLNGNPPVSGAITFFGQGAKANATNGGLSVGFQNIGSPTGNATYTFQRFDASLALVDNYAYSCIKNANNDCPGLTVSTSTRQLVFENVVMRKVNNMTQTDTGQTATFNGTLKY